MSSVMNEVAVTSEPAPTSTDATPMRMLRVLSNSEKRCFQSCKRKHYIRYRLLKRPLRSADPLRFGTLIHKGLEAWWRAGMTGADRLTAALAAVREEEKGDPFELAKAEALLTGYHARWADQIVEVLAVEVEFKAPIVNPATGKTSRTYVLGGKIDAIARLDDGLVYLVEHKTSSEDVRAGSDYWKRLRLDSQVSDYYVGARALGFEVAGCLYDVLAKPRIDRLEATPPDKRKYTKAGALYAAQRADDETLEKFRERLHAHIAENLDRYYARGTIVRLEDDERDAAFDTWQTAREIREADLMDRHPRNPDACVRYGQTCEYFVVCSRETDLDDPTRYRTAPAAHEELSVRVAS